MWRLSGQWERDAWWQYRCKSICRFSCYRYSAMRADISLWCSWLSWACGLIISCPGLLPNLMTMQWVWNVSTVHLQKLLKIPSDMMNKQFTPLPPDVQPLLCFLSHLCCVRWPAWVLTDRDTQEHVVIYSVCLTPCDQQGHGLCFQAFHFLGLGVLPMCRVTFLFCDQIQYFYTLQV